MLSAAILTGSNFSGANLRQATMTMLTQAEHVDFTGAALDANHITDSHLHHAKFDRVRVQRLNWQHHTVHVVLHCAVTSNL